MRKYTALYILVATLISITALMGAKAVFSASDMSKAQKGKILLQVEANGEAWYVNPSDEMRYYMGRPEDAFGLMRQLGVGIKNADLEKIRVAIKNTEGPDSDGDGLSDDFEVAIGTNASAKDSDKDSYSDRDELANGYNPNGAGVKVYDNDFANKQKGKIFLQVERNGEAWYVNPEDGLRYFMGRPADAFNLMRGLGLGITNANLAKIEAKNNVQVNNAPQTSETTDDTTGTESAEPAQNSGLEDVIAAHQSKMKGFITAYDNDDFTVYGTLVNDIFTLVARETAMEKVDDFFITFVNDGLKTVADVNLNEEYQYALSTEDMPLPYEQTDAQTIVIGLGVEGAMPYKLKLEEGVWRVDIAYAREYYNENEKIADIWDTSEGSEVEVYLMNKIKDALIKYKKSEGKYPAFLGQALSIYPAMKDYLEMFYYATSADSLKCHYGVEIYDDDAELNKDKDFNSLDAGYTNGFSGEDPAYDLTLE